MRESHAILVWSYGRPFAQRRALLGALATLVVLALIAWGVVGFVLSLVMPDALAVAVAGVIALAGVAIVSWRRYRALSSRITTVEPGVHDRRRVEALIEGLRTQIGIARGKVAFVDSGAVNAAALPDGTVLVTTGALARCDQTELEALLARELVALRANLVRGYGLLAVAGRLRGGELLRRESAMLDLAAVSVTRFPPAMASVMDKALQDADSDLARVAPAWFWAFPVSGDQGASDLELRRQAVLDEIWTVGVSRPRHT